MTRNERSGIGPTFADERIRKTGDPCVSAIDKDGSRISSANQRNGPVGHFVSGGRMIVLPGQNQRVIRLDRVFLACSILEVDLLNMGAPGRRRPCRPLCTHLFSLFQSQPCRPSLVLIFGHIRSFACDVPQRSQTSYHAQSPKIGALSESCHVKLKILSANRY